VTFIAYIKLLKLLRFNKRLLMLGMVFTRITGPLLNFMSVLGIMFIGYALMTNTVYGTQLDAFSSFTSTCKYLLTLVFSKYARAAGHGCQIQPLAAGAPQRKYCQSE